MIQDILVSNLIPQRAPFVMIDKLLEAYEDEAITCFTIKPDNVLVSGNKLTESGLIENMAQSSAAMSGFNNLGEEPKIGFIAAIKDLTINELPEVSKTIVTRVKVINRVLEFLIVRAVVFIENRILAECELKIFIKP